MIAASGPGARCGASSAHVCVLAATSGSGPSAKRPAPSRQHPRGPLSRRLEREAVLGERRRRPELLPPLECPAAPVAELDEPVPVPCRAEPVDGADELVEVALLDDLA